MRRERLLIVIDGMEVGGSQRQVQQLLKGLDRQRWEPELAYFRDRSFLVDAISAEGTPVHFVPKRHRVDLPFLFKFARLLRRGDYALVHAFSLTAELSSVFARLLSGRHPLLVASERSFALDRPRWFWWLKRLALRQSVAVIANSRAGASATARRTRVPEAIFATVSNGVNAPEAMSADARAELREALGVPEGRLFGVFVGRLAPVKNLPCLVHALSQLAPTHRPWMAFVGTGPEQAAIERLGADLGVNADLRFLGERTDVDQVLQAADFLVLPSHFEGLSNALLEAMAAGCPVIASAVGGTLELIDDGQTGLLFSPGDAAALAAAMTRMADPVVRRALAQRARERVERQHTHAALGAATAAIYERCLRAAVPGETHTAHPARGHAK